MGRGSPLSCSMACSGRRGGGHGWTCGDVELDGGVRLHYYRTGGGKSWRKSVARTQAITREERIGQLKRLRPSWTEEQWASCADSERQVDLGVFDLVKSGGPAWRQVVRKVRCPILLLTGDPRAGAIVKPEVAREATGLCSDLRVAHIAGAGHNIHAEHAAEFGVAVARFLNEDADSVGSS